MIHAPLLRVLPRHPVRRLGSGVNRNSYDEIMYNELGNDTFNVRKIENISISQQTEIINHINETNTGQPASRCLPLPCQPACLDGLVSVIRYIQEYEINKLVYMLLWKSTGLNMTQAWRRLDGWADEWEDLAGWLVHGVLRVQG